MSKEMHASTIAAAAALEAALNNVENDQAVEVATKLIMLSTGFLRAVCGDDWVKGFLEEGLRDLDQPALIKVYTVPKSKTQH